MVTAVKQNLLSQNSAFQFFQLEAPTLIPREHVNKEYNEDDLFITNRDDLVLRAETTASSYLYAEHLLNTHNDMKVRCPLVVWQHAKSYRNEQDKVLKNMRLKEFYQLEFQILYKNTTKNDYSLSLMPAVKAAFESMLNDCRLEESDRLPSYSEQTIDVVCEKTNMEVCSMSKRTDFPIEDINVLEIALGTDRCIYNFKNKD
jgi:glycyl-tRNA synthetase